MKTKNIENRIYYIDYIVDKHIFVKLFGIHHKYRKRGYSPRILNNIINKYKKPMYLECAPSLVKYYKHIGFEFICETYDGFSEMVKYYRKSKEIKGNKRK